MNEHSSIDQHCPLCSENKYNSYRFGLISCKSCKLVLSPLLWQPQVNERMEEAWFSDEYNLRKSSVWVEWFEAWNNRKTLARLSGLTSNCRLLEIGVGSGSFLVAAKAKGFDVMGCDLSVPICRRVERESGITVYCGSLTELPGNSQFDAVVMNHVLEHVQHPVEFLQHVHRLLKPGGMVHIAVPNIDCWAAQLSGWTSFEPYHLTYFNRQTLMKACIASGLTVEGVLTNESFSGWFLALMRTALGVNRENEAVTSSFAKPRVRSNAARMDWIEHAYRLAMVIFGGGLWPLRQLQGKLGYGDEISCVARRPAL